MDSMPDDANANEALAIPRNASAASFPSEQTRPGRGTGQTVFHRMCDCVNAEEVHSCHRCSLDANGDRWHGHGWEKVEREWVWKE